MKRNYSVIFILAVCMVYVCGVPSGFAQQGEKETPPGLEEKQGTPPGESTKQEDVTQQDEPVQWLSPRLAKKSGILSLQVTQKYQQQWCLEHNGLMNVVLSDKSICGCLTETHAVAFASETNWAASLGQVLYHALITDRQPGIILFHETGPNPPYVLLLDTVVKNYELPITVWKQEIDLAEEKEKESSKKRKVEKTPKKDEPDVPFLLNEPQVDP